MNGTTPSNAALARELTVVVRSIGERTTEACLYLLRRELPAANIELVKNIPFDQAVRRTFELGLASGRPWVLALDSDMLLRPSALARMVEAARAQPENVFALWTMALDKAFRVYRPVGMHLYRASLLARAREMSEGRDLAGSLRPESAMVEAMLDSGFLAAQTGIVVGLHDYEQAYRDLIKKACVHARKHRDMVGRLRPVWRGLAEQDPDFVALLRGADFGEMYAGEIGINHFQLSRLTEKVLEEFGRPEKAPFEPAADLPEKVEATLAAMDVHPDRLRLQPQIFPETIWNRLDGKVA
ncbi:group 1 glycosyl transferase [Desulfovibrio sp. X2]|uniref:glycosyltransferase family A protein n=1 Tax=Desulfovibrio sp. X2 TaxID=941449 RepID=UPI000358E8BB|nr:glycosyltransferase family A protein [Desulfovibrio sp. X2]EPR37193.1 group 1 glycosyl transferase [Desulfovibrio sp. X2]